MINLYFDLKDSILPVKVSFEHTDGLSLEIGLTAEMIHDAHQWLEEQGL
ncbi:hypothetical protein SEA_WEASELS2_154 [Rhodococcus phage Weasels2]|uniref:Uncharacterized protein n=1 Tax=Rhodococcus phage Weasels2 TaxID=1897437 RepID=A0A1I9SAC8_9CAUD|nr:hypothetical protein FDH04_gp260 [Rhodococcus phage Weasels2]AOZ63734.1 hypothetical protein SEA_WEASELS2_154 [Rhodococcus phage Weasels2]